MRTMSYADPSPSRLRYRFERIWLKRSVRLWVTSWIPSILIMALAWNVAGNRDVQGTVRNAWTDLRTEVAARPELQVTGMRFPDVSAALQAQIKAVVPMQFPVSSLDINVASIKSAVENLDAVKSADVSVAADGVLEIRAVERIAVTVLRQGTTLLLVDGEGHRVAEIARRSARSDLPLVAGENAAQHVAEAMKLVAAAQPIAARLRGLVRVGDRRWDVVLDRGQTIMLPENGAVTALKRVLEMQRSEDLLSRDVVVVDMRDPARPVLRLGDHAIKELRQLRAAVRGESA